MRKKVVTSEKRNQDITKFTSDLPLHMPPVQFATLISLPWQDRPPWLGGGSSHVLLLVCVQSLPHTDHADHLDHCPSTAGKRSKIEASFRSESLRRVRSMYSDNKKVRQDKKARNSRESPRIVSLVRDYTYQFGYVYCYCTGSYNDVIYLSLLYIIDSYRYIGMFFLKI